MKLSTIQDAYAYYMDLTAGTGPRDEDDLRSLVHAAGIVYKDIDNSFWDLAFGADVGQSWAWGTIQWPTDEQWGQFERAYEEGDN